MTVEVISILAIVGTWLVFRAVRPCERPIKCLWGKC
jgi:hypothetical protein